MKTLFSLFQTRPGKRVHWFIAIYFAVFSLGFSSQSFGEITLYPWAETVPQSNKYRVRLFNECEIFEPVTLYSEPNLEQGIDGDGVTGLIEDRSMSYTPFAFDEMLTVEATKIYGSSATRVEISPKSYGIEPEYFDGKTVRFQLEPHINPAYLSINFVTQDNQDAGNNGAVTVKNGLLIFADKPETNKPDLTSPGIVNYTEASREAIENADIVYFPPGDYSLKDKFGEVFGKGTDARIYFTRHNQQVYLAPGAFVRGSFDSNGFDKMKIRGRGVISGEDFYWHYFQDPFSTNGKTKTPFLDYRGSHESEFDGFIVVNPTHHTIPSGNFTKTKNMKIIGWASNHDGVRPGGGSLIEEVFIKTSDDLDYARDPHLFQNSVIWPMRNGAFGMLGWKFFGTGYTHYKNIQFIHTEWDINANEKRNTGIIGAVLQQGAFLTNNLIEDIQGEWGTGMLANISIQYEPNANNNHVQEPINGLWAEVKNFTFKNIILEGTFQNSGGNLVKNQLRGFEHNGAKATVHDINFINVIAGNTLITHDNYEQFFDIDENTTYNIDFRQEGILHTISTDNNTGGVLRPSGAIPTPDGMNRFISVIADPGYQIDQVIIDGISKGRQQTIYFPQISQDHKVQVIFTKSDNDFFVNNNQCDIPPPKIDDAPIIQLPLLPFPSAENLIVALGSFLPDIMLGTPGDDFIQGFFGNDAQSGGIGNDLMSGGANRDYMRGDDGQDWLMGGDDDDEVFGDNGDDDVFGGAGKDIVVGGNGNDLLDGGRDGSRDLLRGLAGADIYKYAQGYGFDVIQAQTPLSNEEDVILFGEDISPEHITFAKNGNNLLIRIAPETSKNIIQINKFFLNTGFQALVFSDGQAITDEAIQQFFDDGIIPARIPIEDASLPLFNSIDYLLNSDTPFEQRSRNPEFENIYFNNSLSF